MKYLFYILLLIIAIALIDKVIRRLIKKTKKEKSIYTFFFKMKLNSALEKVKEQVYGKIHMANTFGSVKKANEYLDKMCSNLGFIECDRKKIKCEFILEEVCFKFTFPYENGLLFLKFAVADNPIIPLNNVEFQFVRDYEVICGGNLDIEEFVDNIPFYLQTS